MNLPVKVRSNELKQVKKVVTQLIDNLEQAELPEAADELSRIYDEHISGVERGFEDEDNAFAAYLSMPLDDWRIVIRHLNRARREEGTIRVQYLQNKLVSRIEDRIEDLEE